LLQAGAFEGPVTSWAEAMARSDGWDAPVITSKTLESALQVRDGLAIFEQDGVIRENILYSTTVLASIIFALSLRPGHLNVIEFGGGLGTGYFQNRKILQNLRGVQISWNIVERPDLAALGSEHFEKSDLHFFSSVDAAIASLKEIPDLFLFSGSLQCIAEPLTLLDRMIKMGARVLAFDRLLVSPTAEHAVFIQHPDPKKHYPATYPAWCFSKDVFIRDLVEKRFTLVDHFSTDPQAHFDHCGMIFIHHPWSADINFHVDSDLLTSVGQSSKRQLFEYAKYRDRS
jgi:putative methyltransferase (TIGR04325 family)